MLRKWNYGLIGLAVLLAAGLVLVGCNGDDPVTDECPEGEIWDPDLEECVEEPVVCELWEPDCCLRTRHTGQMAGIRDCYQLSTGTHSAACDRDTGTCILLCNEHGDCSDWEYYADRCGDGECVCDDGVCPLPACSSHADCVGEGLCIGGECLPGVTDPDGCVISPSPVYTTDGVSIALHAYATKGGEYAVVEGEFSWDSDSPSVASVDADGVVTGGAEDGGASITASFGNAECDVNVTNFGALESGDMRVVVIDEITRLPVTDGVVVADAGEPMEGDIVEGAVTLAGIDSGALVDVHVFAGPSADAPNGYSYISLLGTTERDLIFYLPHNPAEQGGGIKGTLGREDFTHISTDDVHVALAGLSIPGNFIDLDLEMLIGEMIDTHVEFQGLIDDEIPLPSGVVLGLSDSFFKDWYAPVGVPGLRTGWMLGGNLSLTELVQLAGPYLQDGVDDVDDLPIGQILGAILPMFESFYSGVTPGIDIEAGELPGSPSDWPPADFQDGDLALTNPLALKGIVNMPGLPQVDGAWMDGAIVLGGAMVEGQGLVPLGLTAGVDTEDPEVTAPNGVINEPNLSEDPAVGAGQLGIRIAPQHSGIEGSSYTLLSLALSFDGLMDEEGRYPLSGLMTTFDSLGFEQEIGFGADDFLGVPESARYDSGERLFTPGAVAGADMYRASITGQDGGGWVVYHDGTDPFHLIEPPAGFEDRASSYINAQAVMTRSGETLESVFSFNETNLDDLVHLVSGFSTMGVPEE